MLNPTRRRRRPLSFLPSNPVTLGLLCLAIGDGCTTTTTTPAFMLHPGPPIREVDGRARPHTARGGHEISMAMRKKQSLPSNALSANLFVDKCCNNCGTCRWMCPGVFGELGMRSRVLRDPRDEEESRQAYRAMVTCPNGAIRLKRPDPLVKAVVKEDFPMPVDPDRLPGVYHLGYHDRNAGATAPYLIVREGGKGNIMIDAPRFNGRLGFQVEELGGVAFHLYTHKDTTPEQEKWAAFFSESERLIHRFDSLGDTLEFECRLNGRGPWEIGDDIKIVYVPGHTLGSVAVVYRSPVDTAVFTGGHLGWSSSLGMLDGDAQHNRGGIERQADSMRKLAEEEEFDWLLPGWGPRMRFDSQEEKRRKIMEAAAAFEQRGKVLPVLG